MAQALITSYVDTDPSAGDPDNWHISFSIHYKGPDVTQALLDLGGGTIIVPTTATKSEVNRAISEVVTSKAASVGVVCRAQDTLMLPFDRG